MVKITIRTDNAAFQDGNRAEEVSRILRGLSNQLFGHTAGMPLKVYDTNGNKVGNVVLTGKDRQL